MPPQKNCFNKDHLDRLKTFTNSTFTEPVKHSFQCEHLSKHIKKVTGVYVSPQTLRRFFGFIQTDFSPSVKTLNALAAYNGFLNWHSFTEQFSDTNFQPLTLDQEANLYLRFYEIEVKEEADMNYHNASKNFALRILSNPALLSKLSSSLACNPVSQIYFFERFPHIDGLHSDVYKRAIQQYLQKKTDDAQVFGNSLLYLSNFLCNKPKDAKKYFERMVEVQINNTMHPFAIARFVGTNILHSYLNNENIEHWINEATKWNQFFLRKGKIKFWSFPYFQHMIANYMNLCGLFEESYSIVKTIQQFDKDYEIESGYKEALQIICGIARHSVSSFDYKNWFISESEKYFETITPIFKKYHELQALCVYRSYLFGKKKQKVTENINRLIAQTGFIYFSNFLL
jgi:hypothetical protein